MHGEGGVIPSTQVELCGFTAINNQRFGSQFVGRVANPASVLKFQRSKVKRSGGCAPQRRHALQRHPTFVHLTACACNALERRPQVAQGVGLVQVPRQVP